MIESEMRKLDPEELINLSETNTSDFRWNRSNIYKVAFEKYEKIGEKDKAEDLRKEIGIMNSLTPWIEPSQSLQW